MADNVRRAVTPLLPGVDAAHLEIVVGALEIAVEARCFDEDAHDECHAALVAAGYDADAATRRCVEIAVALGLATYVDDRGGERDGRPLRIYAAAGVAAVAALAVVLRMKDGRGIALVAEYWTTALTALILAPVFHGLRGQRMGPDSDD